MTDWFWNKINTIASVIAIIFLFGFLIFSANIEVKDTDLWLHLATGKYIVQNLEIPQVDILSATIAGKEWINHEWLFQVIVHTIYRWGGADGLISMQVVVVGVTFALLLFLGYRREHPVLPVFLLLLVLCVYQIRLTIRPDIFSLLFFTLYVQTLSQQLDQKKSLGILFVLQVLWTNIHGFFILGPLLVMINLGGEWCKRRIRLPFEWNQVARLDEGEYKRLKQILIGVVVACLFNPQTFKGAWYPISVLFSVSGDSQMFFQSIGELRKPILWKTLFSLDRYPAFKMLIVFSAGSFVWNRRKMDVGLFLFWLVFLLLALSAVRNIVLFAFAAYLVIIVNSYALPIYLFGRQKMLARVCPIIFNMVIIFWITQHVKSMSYRGYYDFDKFERKSEYGGISLRNFPYKAADFLVDNKIQGKFFNDFNSGAYLLGRAFPNIKVFMDGRTELYGADYFRNYKKIWHGDAKLFEEAVTQYGLTGAFLNSVYVPAPREFIHYLNEHEDWIPVYFDYDATIFLKDIPENRKWIDQYRINWEQWQPQEIDLLKIGLHRVSPYRNINRAWALYNMEFYQKAKKELLEFLRVEELNIMAHKLIGKIYIKEKNFSLALEHLRKAKLGNSGDLEVRYHLAESFYHLNDLSQAREQIQIIIERKPNNYKAILLSALIYIKENQYAQAFDLIGQIDDKKIKNYDELFSEIEDLLRERGELEKAEEILKKRKSDDG